MFEKSWIDRRSLAVDHGEMAETFSRTSRMQSRMWVSVVTVMGLRVMTASTLTDAGFKPLEITFVSRSRSEKMPASLP